MSKKAQLLSSVNGEITAVLLVYPGLTCDQGDAEYADIVAAFDRKGAVYRFRMEAPGFTIRVSRSRGLFHHPRRTREILDLRPGTNIQSVLASWEAEIKSVRENEILTFRRWAQDPFLVLKTADWTILLDSLHNRRLCDFFLPLEVAQQAGPDFLVRPTRLYLEGGNVLRGNRCVFIGQDLIQDNMNRLEHTEAEVLDEFRQVLGVDEILQVGWGREVTRLNVDGGEGAETWQPLFHIDMFMSLGGMDAGRGQEVIFLGSPSLAVELLKTANNPKVLASEVEARADGLFQEIGLKLRNAGFRVISLPIFFYDNATFSWNNCLVEVYAGQKRVYLPSYQCAHDPEKLNPSFACLEAEVARIYASQGFEVTWFPNGRFFRTLARHGGSLHCAVKVMARRDD
jgi:hypothetical protein